MAYDIKGPREWFETAIVRHIPIDLRSPEVARSRIHLKFNTNIDKALVILVIDGPLVFHHGHVLRSCSFSFFASLILIND